MSTMQVAWWTIHSIHLIQVATSELGSASDNAKAANSLPLRFFASIALGLVIQGLNLIPHLWLGIW